MFGLISILVFILDLVAIIDCVQSPMDGTKKLLWILLILVLPFLGMILYFLLAKNKLA